MNTYRTFLGIHLALALRSRTLVAFNYLLPVLFFLVLAGVTARRGGGIQGNLAMALVVGVIGNGLYGGGMQIVAEREANILRRLKMTPVGPGPILAASLVSGWLLYMPAVALLQGLAYLVYGSPFPAKWLSELALLTAGILCFRSLGLIVASTANSVQEASMMTQALYLPMMFFSGTTIPVSQLPTWGQTLSTVLPARHLVEGLQSVVGVNAAPTSLVPGLLALLLTAGAGVTIAYVSFRWHREDRVPPRSKFALVLILLPSLVMAVWKSL